MSQHDLGQCVINALEQYFRDLDGEQPSAIYDMVLKSVEKPMLEVVLANDPLRVGKIDQSLHLANQSGASAQ